MVYGDRGVMILIISINDISFHYFEFVKPIEDIVKQKQESFFTLHYKNVTSTHIKKADKIIIAGTSLKDNTYLKDTQHFQWIKTYQNPILGICGGMQLLALVFNENIYNNQEIGLKTVAFHKSFLGQIGKKEVYTLHNNYVEPRVFETFATSDMAPQAIKHPKKPCYGVLFHPEVRNKELIISFLLNREK